MRRTKKLGTLIIAVLFVIPLVAVPTSSAVDQPNVSYVPGELIVRFKGDTQPFRVVKLPANELVQDALKRFSTRSDIEYAEPNYLAHAFLVPNDPYYAYQWHLDNALNGGIHTQAAWDTTQGSGVTVAVVDTGIAYENYFDIFRGKYFYKAPDLASTCFVSGYDFIWNDTHANDDNSHGTHVSGTIAQSTNNSTGVAGVAYKSCLMPVKVLDGNGSGTYSQVASGIRFAADNGADVINLSLGGSASSQTLLDAVSYAYNKGVTIVAAAGNDGAGTISYPAAYDDYVMAVGATRFDETRAYYSNYGSSLDLMAPGGDTGVDQNGDGYVDGVLQNTFNPNTKQTNSFGYWFFQGTSMASPHVAGVAALVISKGNASSPGEVRTALESTADDLGAAGRDNTYGWGLVNAPAALAWTSGPVDNPPSVSIINPLDGSAVAGTINIQADATDDFGVSQVDFYIDDALIGTDTSLPYEILWDSILVADGAHVIKAKATDTASQSSSDSVNVGVNNVNDPPVAMAGSDQSVYIGQIVNFDGSGSYDPDGSITDYSWDFGDGASASGVNVSHTYTLADNYTVTLMVTDNGGLTNQDSAIVTVTEVPAIIEVFFDSFEVAEWNGLWTEDSQNDWSRSSQRASGGSYAAEVDGYAVNARLISVPINLQGRSNATITFSWFIESSLDSGEYVAFDISTDGGSTWVEKARIRGNVDPEQSWQNVSVDVLGIANLKVRFRGKMSLSDEDANVDVVKVTAW